MKKFKDDLISEILSSSGFGELKNNIETLISKFKSQGLNENQMKVLLNDTLRDLKHLNEGRFPYEQHANIISAKNILRKLPSHNSDATDRI